MDFVLRKSLPVTLVVLGVGFLLAGLRVELWWHEQHLIQSCIAPHEVALSFSLERVLRRQGDAVSVLARINSGPLIGCVSSRDKRLKLSYFGHEQIGTGDHVLALVRIKPLTGALNPGLFRYRLWAMAQGYLAAGHVHELQQVRHPPRPVQHERGFLLYAGVLNALREGDRAGIDDRLWQLFRQTGTVHLVVISGLHVGIYAGICGFVVLWGLRGLTGLGLVGERFLQILSLRQMSMLAALSGVWVLVSVTGAQPAVLRAAIMTSLGIGLLLIGRGLTHQLRIWLLAALCVVMVKPANVVLSGYWLSFGAVLVILLYLSGRQNRPGRAGSVLLFGRLQWALFVGLAPWVAHGVGQLTLLGPPANLLAVPVITLVTMPVVVAASAAELLASWTGWHTTLWRMADFSVWCVVRMLQTVRELLPGGVLSVGYFSPGRLLFLTGAAFILLLPCLVRCKLVVVGLALALLYGPRGEAVKYGQFRIHMFDVGQGGAAMVTTANRRLLIDAGPAYPFGSGPGFDSGEAIVWPSVMRLGAPPADGLVVTHEDADHAGGLEAVRGRLPQVRVVAGQLCRHGASWWWDGVRFELHRDAAAANDNDRSCTVLLRGADRMAYFSGDISARTERQLLPGLPRNIDFLAAPHHGSRSSSSWNFVAHLSPRVIVHSAGAHNRYGHPHAEVLARFEALGGRNFVTAQSGAIVWDSAMPDSVIQSRLGRVDLD